MKKILAMVIITMFWIPIGNIEPIKVEKQKDYFDVSVTMYTVDNKQTDSTPLLTASGFKLDSIRPKKHRIIAVSRDLKKKLKFGQKVRVEGTGKWDGIYRVEDVMNARWKNKIDILIDPEEGAASFKKAKLYLK
jgi:3D (Asp-Asp-Asp) domain-containing protein